MMNKVFKTVDEYIESFPSDIQILLRQIRETVKKSAPQADEAISYGMPAYKLNGKPLVYFAAFKNHVGFYPTASGVEKFIDKLGDFKTSKGAIQFPLDKPLPIELIIEIIEFRVKENLSKPTKKK